MDPDLQKLLAVLTFILSLIVVEVFVIRKAKTEWERENIVRFIGLTLIVGAVFALVLLPVKAEYIASVIGLLGAVAGHFLRPEPKPDKKPDGKLGV